jgi:hypothetical protein
MFEKIRFHTRVVFKNAKKLEAAITAEAHDADGGN